MKVAVIADVHIGPEKEFKGKILKLSRHSESELKRFINKVSEMTDIDAVVELGDLIQEQDYKTDAKNYQDALNEFKKLPQSTYHVIGNHDQVFLGDEDLRFWLGLDHLFYSFDCDGYKCVVLFSERRMHNFLARVGIAQLDWLKKELKESKKPVIIFAHYPVDDQSFEGNPWFEERPELGLTENRAEVRKVLEDSGKVVAVISAHNHWYKLNYHNNIPYITLQSLVENIGDNTPALSWSILTFEPGKINLQTFGNDSREVNIPLKK